MVWPASLSQRSGRTHTENANALVLGRLYMNALGPKTPDLSVAGMLSLHYLVGAPVWQKHHSRTGISMFWRRGCALVPRGHRGRICRTFCTPPPGEWSLTVSLCEPVPLSWWCWPMFTDASGQIAVELLGRTPHCPRSTAAEVGGSVVTRLETSLRLNTRTAECATSLGLAVARLGETSAQRGMLLTCTLCD